MDVVDKALSVIEEVRDAGIARAAEALAAAGSPGCTDCGDDIGAARRAALPSARRCISCQDAAEQRARQQIGETEQ